MSYKTSFRSAWVGAVSLIAVLLTPSTAGAQLGIDDNAPVAIDYSGFDGSGFLDGGGGGTLNSDHWRVFGMSEGDTTFDGTHITGDFARGLSSGGVGIGGLYAWDVNGDGSVIAAGWQPSGSDATPGTMVLRIRNDFGPGVASLTVSFDLWVNNDQGRSSTVSLGYKLFDASDPLTNESGTIVSSFTTASIADAAGFGVTPSGSIVIPQSLMVGEILYLIWSTDDAAGAGSRDEFGIADLTLSLNASPSVPTVTEWGLALAVGLMILSGFVALKRPPPRKEAEQPGGESLLDRDGSAAPRT